MTASSGRSDGEIVCLHWYSYACRSVTATVVGGLVRYGCATGGVPQPPADPTLAPPPKPLWWRAEARRGLRDLDAYLDAHLS